MYPDPPPIFQSKKLFFLFFFYIIHTFQISFILVKKNIVFLKNILTQNINKIHSKKSIKRIKKNKKNKKEQINNNNLKKKYNIILNKNAII